MNKKLVIILAIVISLLILAGGAYYFINNKTNNYIIAEIDNEIKKIDPNAEFKFSKLTKKGFLKPSSISFTDAELLLTHHNVSSAELLITLENEQINSISAKNIFLNIKVKAKDSNGVMSMIHIKDTAKILITESAESTKYNLDLPRILEYSSVDAKNIVEFREKIEFFIEVDQSNRIKVLQYADKGIDIFKDEITDENLVASSEDNHISVISSEKEASYIYDIDISSQNNNIVVTEQKIPFLEKSLAGFAFKGEFETQKKEHPLYKLLYIDLAEISFGNLSFEFFGELRQDIRSMIPYGEIDILLHNYKILVDNFDKIKEQNLEDIDTKFLQGVNQERLLAFLLDLNKTNSDILTLRVRRSMSGTPLINELSLKEISELLKKHFAAPLEEDRAAEDEFADDEILNIEDEEEAKPDEEELSTESN